MLWYPHRHRSTPPVDTERPAKATLDWAARIRGSPNRHLFDMPPPWSRLWARSRDESSGQRLVPRALAIGVVGLLLCALTHTNAWGDASPTRPEVPRGSRHPNGPQCRFRAPLCTNKLASRSTPDHLKRRCPLADSHGAPLRLSAPKPSSAMSSCTAMKKSRCESMMAGAPWPVGGSPAPPRCEPRCAGGLRCASPSPQPVLAAMPRPELGGGPSGISSEAVAGAVRTLTPRHPQVLCSAAAGGGAGSFTCAAQISLTQTADGVGPPTMILSIGAP